MTEAKKNGETHFVLECDISNLDEVLRQAQQVGIMSDLHNYIITDPDFQTLDLQPYQWGGSNITGFRMLDPEDEDIIEVARDLEKRKQEFNPETEPEREPEYKFKMKTALIYDAVYVYALALRHLDHMEEVKSLYCNMTDNWEHGLSLVTYMRTASKS